MSKRKLRGVLLHGWGGSINSLRALNEQLTLEFDTENWDYRAKLVELPGFGETMLVSVMHLADYCAYVEQVIADLNIQPDEELVLIGHSLGGKILLQLASGGKFPRAHLVLINASGLKPRNSLKRRVFKTMAGAYRPMKGALNTVGLGGLQRLVRKAGYKFLVKARDYEKLSDPKLTETFQHIINTHLDESALKNIQQPTLLLWGAADRDTPLWMGQKLHTLIPQSQLVTVTEATHGLPLKQPEKCSEIITSWLALLPSECQSTHL